MWLLLFFVIGWSFGEPCVERSGLIGSYRPQCLMKGMWRPKQCWGSVGMCWCVHSETGEKLSDPVHAWELETIC